jgi:hypothetical protein
MKAVFWPLNSLFILFLLLILPSSLFATTFSSNLKIGDRNNSVLELQKVLNSDSRTKIAVVGVGSPGNESTYFGALTQKAVIKFQNTYNISPALGFVGPLTREKLNQIQKVAEIGINPSNSSTQTPSIPIVSTKKAPVLVFGTNPARVKPGSTFSVLGYGFTSNNNVFLKDKSFPGLISTSTRELKLTLPESFTEGEYVLKVVNENGDSSKTSTSTIKMFVTKDDSLVQISKITPLRASLADEIVITGTGFDVSDNTVITSLGIISKVSSSQDVIKFKMSSITGSSNWSKVPGLSSKTIPLSVIVLNKNGSSQSLSINFLF